MKGPTVLQAMGKPRPCPFCGKTGVSYITTQGYKWGAAMCNYCAAMGPEVRTGYKETEWHPDALEEWNERKPPKDTEE